MKRNGEVKKEAKFIYSNGEEIDKDTLIDSLLMEPYFILKIDGEKEYNILSERSFSYKNYKFYLDDQEKGIYENCKNIGMRD